MKGRIDTMNPIKIKNFCSVQDPVNRMKREATDQEKIFANHILTKGLVSRICRELLKLTGGQSKLRQTIQFKKLTKGIYRS